MDDTRMSLQRFVESGNMRIVDADPPKNLDKQWSNKLSTRLKKFQGLKTSDLQPSDNPGDFRQALQDREEIAIKREAERKDIPRVTTKNNEVNYVLDRFYKGHDIMASFPSPGGLGTIFLIIILFFLLIIPATAKGETRTLLLWDVLLGRKKLDTTIDYSQPVGKVGDEVGIPTNSSNQTTTQQTTTQQTTSGAVQRDVNLPRTNTLPPVTRNLFDEMIFWGGLD